MKLEDLVQYIHGKNKRFNAPLPQEYSTIILNYYELLLERNKVSPV